MDVEGVSVWHWDGSQLVGTSFPRAFGGQRQPFLCSEGAQGVVSGAGLGCMCAQLWKMCPPRVQVEGDGSGCVTSDTVQQLNLSASCGRVQCSLLGWSLVSSSRCVVTVTHCVRPLGKTLFSLRQASFPLGLVVSPGADLSLTLYFFPLLSCSRLSCFLETHRAQSRVLTSNSSLGRGQRHLA